VVREVEIEVVDLEEHHVAAHGDGPKVVLVVWVVVLVEAVKLDTASPIRRSRSDPSALIPGVSTTRPLVKVWRRSSFSARVRSVFVSIDVILKEAARNAGARVRGREDPRQLSL
jgi:hypothetical protein